MSLITATGDAVVTAINDSGLLPSPAVAVRRIIPTLEIEVSKDLQVQVITPRIDRSRQNRSTFRNTFVLQVGVFQLLPASNDQPPAAAAVDPLITLVENLANLRFADVISGSRGASYLNTTINPLYDADRLQTEHQFASVQTLTFVEFQG